MSDITPAAIISNDKNWSPKDSFITFEDKNIEYINLDQIKQATKKYTEKTILFVRGGDGTLNYAVEQIFVNKISSDVRICYIPAGTGNDFSRTLYGRPVEEEEIAKLLSDNKECEITCGRLNNNYFVNMATFGNCAEVTPTTDDSMKEILGRFSYYLHALSLASNIIAFKCEMEVDGEKLNLESDIFSFFIANAKYAGGGVKIYEDASPSKESLALLVIPNMEVTGLSKLFIEMQKDKPDLDSFNVHQRIFKKMKFSTDVEISCTIDGEHKKIQQANIFTCDKKLRFLIPSQNKENKIADQYK